MCWWPTQSEYGEYFGDAWDEQWDQWAALARPNGFANTTGEHVDNVCNMFSDVTDDLRLWSTRICTDDDTRDKLKRHVRHVLTRYNSANMIKRQ